MRDALVLGAAPLVLAGAAGALGFSGVGFVLLGLTVFVNRTGGAVESTGETAAPPSVRSPAASAGFRRFARA